MANRKGLSTSTKQLVLHEAGYKCASPTCRSIITLDIHHMEYVSDDGSNQPDNLLPLCPNCHALHHAGHIPHESVRAWKMLLLTINEAFSRDSLDLLLTLENFKHFKVSGEGVLQCSSLIASKMIKATVHPSLGGYFLQITDRGRRFIDAWRAGDQRKAVEAGSFEPP